MNKEELTTKMRIVNSAIELTKEYGFASVSVNQICKAVGITRSTFYYHFKTKDEVFDYHILNPELYIMDNILPVLDTTDPLKQFMLIINIFLKQLVEVGPEALRLIYKRGIEAKVHINVLQDFTLWQLYVKLIKKAQDSGEIENTANPESIMEAILYMLKGIVITWCNQEFSFDFYAECNRMLDVILH